MVRLRAIHHAWDPLICRERGADGLFLILSRQKIFGVSCICAVKQYVNLQSKTSSPLELDPRRSGALGQITSGKVHDLI